MIRFWLSPKRTRQPPGLLFDSTKRVDGWFRRSLSLLQWYFEIDLGEGIGLQCNGMAWVQPGLPGTLLRVTVNVAGFPVRL